MCKTSVSRVIFVGFGVALLFFLKQLTEYFKAQCNQFNQFKQIFGLLIGGIWMKNKQISIVY